MSVFEQEAVFMTSRGKNSSLIIAQMNYARELFSTLIDNRRIKQSL